MRVLVLGAGGPAGVNTIRALVAAGHDVLANDDNPAHLDWCLEAGAQQALIGDEFDVAIAQPDRLVRYLAENRDAFKGTFLPSLETIETCQAKDKAAAIWYDAGLRGPAIKITKPWPDFLHLAQDKVGSPFWLRATRGAGANKAIKVDRLDSAFHWIRFWETRGVHVEWIAEPYLPGRDLAWSSIWHNGGLISCFLRERLEYLYPHLSPEGLTGTPTIARVVHDDIVESVAYESVLAIDAKPHGIYSVDLREDEHGVANPTEINAGRGFTTLGLWSLYDPDANFYDIAVRLAAGESVAPVWNPFPDGLTLSRHIDCGHVFTREQVPA